MATISFTAIGPIDLSPCKYRYDLKDIHRIKSKRVGYPGEYTLTLVMNDADRTEMVFRITQAQVTNMIKRDLEPAIEAEGNWSLELVWYPPIRNMPPLRDTDTHEFTDLTDPPDLPNAGPSPA